MGGGRSWYQPMPALSVVIYYAVIYYAAQPAHRWRWDLARPAEHAYNVFRWGRQGKLLWELL